MAEIDIFESENKKEVTQQQPQQQQDDDNDDILGKIENMLGKINNIMEKAQDNPVLSKYLAQMTPQPQQQKQQLQADFSNSNEQKQQIDENVVFNGIVQGIGFIKENMGENVTVGQVENYLFKYETIVKEGLKKELVK